jgi:neutral ceramidase
MTILSLLRFRFLFPAFLFFLSSAVAQSGERRGWKAGVARVVITPRQDMWMAGFAARDHESEGALHDLWAKALALEDENGQRAVLITTDLLGFPKGLSDRIRDRIRQKFHLERAQIILNSSHTHSAPVLNDALLDIYPLGPEQLKKIGQYTNKLEDQVVDLVGAALQSLQPAQVYAENGVTRFQVNRRNNDASTLSRRTDLNGPNDYAVPVIKVLNQSGTLMAVAFGYACHNTVLNIYKWSGDYAGFAQLEIEKMYPGTTAMFFQGAGADQNPLPRGTVAFAQQYGRTLAAAVDKVLQEEMAPLASTLSTAYTEVKLPLTKPPSEADFARIAKETSGYQRQWAARMQGKMERGEPLASSYPYPLQVWKLGDQSIMSLGGELVIEYAIELKRIFGEDIFVLGYSNDVMAYIPTTTILREGGYEGQSSQMVYGLPSPWSASIETVILHEMVRLAEHAGVPKAE